MPFPGTSQAQVGKDKSVNSIGVDFSCTWAALAQHLLGTATLAHIGPEIGYAAHPGQLQVGLWIEPPSPGSPSCRDPGPWALSWESRTFHPDCSDPIVGEPALKKNPQLCSASLSPSVTKAETKAPAILSPL
jgi:hypothetical protein